MTFTSWTGGGERATTAKFLVMSCRILIVVAVAVVSWAAPARAENAQRQYQVDTLRADFILPTELDGKYRYLVANIYRRTNLQTGEVVLSAVTGRGSCVLSAGATSCGADLARYEVLRFDADPAFATAEVVLKRGRQRHTLKFTTSTPYVYIPPASQQPTHLCEGGTVTKAYLMAKNSNAEGILFGRKVSTADEATSYSEAEDMEQSIENHDCP